MDTAPTDDPLLDAVHDSVLALAAPPGRRPVRVRVSAGDITVEVDWTEAAAANAGVAPPVAVAVPAPGDDGVDDVADGVPADGRVHVCSPTAGTFYRSPSPGEPPFVVVGDVIGAGRQVGVVESMKIFFPVNAEVAGSVVAVMVDDGEVVDHDQPLVSVRPG